MCVVAQTEKEFAAGLVGGAREHAALLETAKAAGFTGGTLWGMRDILPQRGYLQTVLQCAELLGGGAFVDNVLDGCLLADKRTCIRQYLAASKQPH